MIRKVSDSLPPFGIFGSELHLIKGNKMTTANEAYLDIIPPTVLLFV